MSQTTGIGPRVDVAEHSGLSSQREVHANVDDHGSLPADMAEPCGGANGCERTTRRCGGSERRL